MFQPLTLKTGQRFFILYQINPISWGVATWLQKFRILGSLKAWKYTPQDLLLSQITPSKLNFYIVVQENWELLDE